MDISNRPRTFVRIKKTGQVGLVTDYDRHPKKYLVQCGQSGPYVFAFPEALEELSEDEIQRLGLDGVGRG